MDEEVKAKIENMNIRCEEQRIKNWKELTQEEKIERMRFEMHRLARHVGELSNLLNQLTDHQHLVDGRPATRLGSGYGYPEMPMSERSSQNDKVYF